MISFLVLSLLLTSVSPPLSRVPGALDLWAPQDVVAAWDSFESLKDLPTGGDVAISLQASVPSSEARIDVFERQHDRWEWTLAAKFSEGCRVRQPAAPHAFLVRYRGSHLFFWGEAQDGRRAVSLRCLKSVVLKGAVTGAAIFLASEEEPRLAAGRILSAIPSEEGIACSDGQYQCTIVAPAATEIDFSAAEKVDFRMLRLDVQSNDRMRALALGRVKIRPREVAITVLRAGGWAAIALAENNPLPWEAVVIDRSGDAFASQRIPGSVLVPLPNSTRVLSRVERGLVVRPRIGQEQVPLEDRDALLVAYPDGHDVPSSLIPIATAIPNRRGEFELSQLPSDSYALQLLSKRSSATSVVAFLSSGVPGDVTFPTGPSVRGRLFRTSGGTGGAGGTIEIGPVQEGSLAGRSDVVERTRFATTDDDGSFRVVLGTAGKYRLHATWGTATADRDFSIAASDVDLGEISLGVGSALRGSVEGCKDGQAILIAVPDLSGARAAFGDERQLPLDTRGRFVAEGLTPGKWSVLFRCGGSFVPSSPEVVDVAASGDVIATFQIAQPHLP